MSVCREGAPAVRSCSGGAQSSRASPAKGLSHRTPSAHSRAAATRAPPGRIPGAGKGLCKHSSPSLPAPAQGTAMPTPNKTGVPPAPGSWPPALPRVGFPRGRGWHLSLQPGALLSLCLGLAPWCHSREAAEQPQKVLSRHVCPGPALNQGLQV